MLALTQLHISLESSLPQVNAAITTLASLQQLTHLNIKFECIITNEQMIALLTPHTQLNSLALSFHRPLDSLQFLSHIPHLSRSLRRLSLWGTYLPAAEWLHLRSARSLEYFTGFDAFAPVPSEFIAAIAADRKREMWPNIGQCDYYRHSEIQ